MRRLTGRFGIITVYRRRQRMNKLIAIAIVMCFAATGFAAWGAKQEQKAPPAAEIMKGLVVSVNAPQNEIVVKDAKTGYDKVLIVTPDMYKAFKLGDTVEVKVKTGSTAVDNIKVTKAAPVEKKAEKTKKK
jgi:type IV secretory pathway VirB10-like protein